MRVGRGDFLPADYLVYILVCLVMSQHLTSHHTGKWSNLYFIRLESVAAECIAYGRLYCCLNYHFSILLFSTHALNQTHISFCDLCSVVKINSDVDNTPIFLLSSQVNMRIVEVR